jgi:hypothetical protein
MLLQDNFGTHLIVFRGFVHGKGILLLQRLQFGDWIIDIDKLYMQKVAAVKVDSFDYTWKEGCCNEFNFS